MIKKILVILIILMFILSMVVYADSDLVQTKMIENISITEPDCNDHSSCDIANKSDINTELVVTPNYIPHSCHLGTEHQWCESEIHEEPNCPCYLTLIYCCCGKLTGASYNYCDAHGY